MNNYKNQQTSVESMKVRIKQNIIDYTYRVDELSNLLNEIKESSDWIDDQLKPDFITTCEAFISTYRATIESLNKNINYMETKCQEVASLNEAYKGV